MKVKYCFIIFAILLGLQACKDKTIGNFIVKGKVINITSKEPIDSVMVVLYGGNPLSNPMMQGFNSNPPKGNNDTTYTDKNGEFRVEVKRESAAFIGWVKKGYRNGNINGGNKFWGPGIYDITIEYVAECTFHPFFKKRALNNQDDTLRVYITSYSYPKSYVLQEIYYGKSPFKLNHDLGYCAGDGYFHYKLEYKENNSWSEKIDSVYVKSFQAFSDTIYY